jgi:Zn-finger nucleic acid-binding protein
VYRDATDDLRACPRCASEMHARDLANIRIVECSSCARMYLSRSVVEQARGRDHADAFFALFPAEPPPPPGFKPKPRTPVRCPDCGSTMERRLWHSHSSVVVDVCRHHGMFFDPGELPLMLVHLLARGD